MGFQLVIMLICCTTGLLSLFVLVSSEKKEQDNYRSREDTITSHNKSFQNQSSEEGIFSTHHKRNLQDSNSQKYREITNNG